MNTEQSDASNTQTSSTDTKSHTTFQTPAMSHTCDSATSTNKFPAHTRFRAYADVLITIITIHNYATKTQRTISDRDIADVSTTLATDCATEIKKLLHMQGNEADQLLEMCARLLTDCEMERWQLCGSGEWQMYTDLWKSMVGRMDPLNVAVVERRRSGGRCDSASVNAVVTETYRVSESILLRQERLRDLVEVASFEERSDLPADIMEVVQQQKVDLIQFIKSLERN